MGFRLYVNDDICFGKLYGYTDNSTHLYSIDYLLSISFFDDDDLNEYKSFCESDYESAITYFNCISYGEFEMSYTEFIRYISLYISDYSTRWLDNWIIPDYIDAYNAIKNLPKNKPVKLTWL